MRSGVRKTLDNFYDFAEAKYRAFNAYRGAKRRVRSMPDSKKFQKEYRQEILPYWKQFGHKPSKVWYQLWCAKTGVADPRYIPDSLWYSHIVPYYSNTRFRRPFEDKCYHGVWFADCKRPQTVAMNIAGVFYDQDYKIISLEDALEKCIRHGRFLIKPSIDSGEGRLISFFDRGNATRENILAAFSEFKANFVIQEVISQHPQLSSLNPDSINTIRVISFLYQGEVRILSAILRVGSPGSRVDNFGAGGCSCRILDDGRLYHEAVNKKMQWSEISATGIQFQKVRVPAYDRIIEIIKKKHIQFGHFKLIGWDFGVDAEGEPVFIEFNVCPGQNQEDCGPTFGDLTEEVLKDVFIHRTCEANGN